MCIKPFFKLKIFNRRANKSGIGADQCVHSGFLITEHQKPVRWQSYIHLPTSRRGLEAEDTSNNAVVRVAGHVHDGQTVHEYIFQRDVRSINSKKKKKKQNNFTLLHPSFSFTVLDKYCVASRFLEELLAQGFSIETPELSAVCLKLLAYIVHCQEKSSIQVQEYVRK